jgi:hypothetical protein
MSLGSQELLTFEYLPFIIENYFRQIPVAVLDIKRNESTWTIREHLIHLLGVQKMLLGRMDTIINEPSPTIEPYFPDKQTKNETEKGINLEDLFIEFRNYRKKQIDLIKNLPDNILDKPANHREYINYTIRLMVNHMIYHEYWHMYRIEEIWLTKEEYFQ